ncbi:SWIM zinc finger family protein [Bacillus tuaregi]|uniref:SWIM zinc finger family protein n=1 Tax=Bacillus tuaregi TaxID=1816695 RepID=UPI000AB9B474|nr:SWIM zinc finger family protein [Bacillus tuaregi]
MSLIPESFIEPLQWFSDELKNSLNTESSSDEGAVHKGLILYRQNAVSQLKLEQEAVLGTVQDVIPAKVRLDLNLPYLSECSCPNEGHCRHQLAVFFKVLSHGGGSVSSWVVEWRKPLREKKAAQSFGLERAKDLLKTAGYMKPDYPTWTKSFRESFDQIVGGGNPKPHLVNELFGVYSRRLKAGAPFKQEWKNLYLLIAAVITFEKLLELSLEEQHDEAAVDRHYRHLFQNILDDIADLSHRLSVQSMPFAFDEFIEQLKNDTLPLLLSRYPIQFDRVHLFRLLWSELFKKKEWREDVKAQLEEVPDKTLPVRAGLAHIHLLLREDEKAMAQIQSLDEEITPYFFYWMELLDTKRAEPFVVEFVGRIKEYLRWQNDYYACRSFMRMASQALTPFCAETNRLDLYEKALVQMLPYSFHDYEDFLFEKKEYEKWMELQTYVGFSFENLSKERIKTLSAEGAMVLLPLYHQAIQADIELKNRDAYKQAVRKLKKLRTLYKKMKRVDDWNLFLERLLVRTKRLRAFQEECKRGKLIDA